MVPIVVYLSYAQVYARGVGSVANIITAYEESQIKPRLPFSSLLCVLGFQSHSF